MKKKFSKSWVSSVQPRKQRKYRYNAPLHIRKKFMTALLDKSLRKKFGIKHIPIRKGDEVMVMRGKFKKTIGSVLSVDLKKLKIKIDNVKIKKVSGEEVHVPIDPSNVKIIKLYTEDKKRFKRIRVVQVGMDEKEHGT